MIVPDAAPTQGNVLVTSNTGAVTRLVNGWNFTERGEITNVRPSSGHYGTIVTITGSNLFGGGNFVDSLTLAGVEVDEIVSQTRSQILCIAAATTAESPVDEVTIVADTGAEITLETAWSYELPGVVTEVEPSLGRVGARVTVRGSGMFGGGASLALLTLGDVTIPADNVVSATDTEIEFVVVESTQSSVTITITADTGAIVTSDDNAWTFVASSITSVTPSSGQNGTEVTILGLNLFGGGQSVQRVFLGDTEARIVQDGNGEIGLIAVDGAGNGITIIANTGALISADTGWAYTAPGAITSVTPGTGQLLTRVVISGSNLRGGGGAVASVTLASVEVLSIESESDTQVEVIAAQSTPVSGAVVLVANSGAVVTGYSMWQYVQEGNIATISPTSGVLGTQVTLEGSNLLGGGSVLTQVTLANLLVESIDFQSNTRVVVTAANRTGLLGGTCTLCDASCETCGGSGHSGRIQSSGWG